MRWWLLFLLIPLQFAAIGAEAKPLTPDEIAQAIKQLGDEDFSTREAATKLLWSRSSDAAQELKEATNNPDGEIAARAKQILENLEWGIRPDTPSEVTDKIHEIRNGDPDRKNAAFGELLNLGVPGFEAAGRVCAHETADARTEFAQLMANYSSSNAPDLIADNKEAEAAKILEVCAFAGNDLAVRNFVAYVVRNGQVKERIAELKARRELDDAGKLLLSYLLRAEGDLAAARTTAASLNDKSYKAMLAIEAGDWPALVGYAPDPQPDDNEAPAAKVTAPGNKATSCRLAHDTAGFDAAVAELRKLASEPECASSAAMYLFLNGCFDNDGEFLKNQTSLRCVERLVLKSQAAKKIEALDKPTPEPLTPQQYLSNDIQKADIQFEMEQKTALETTLKEINSKLESHRDGWAVSMVLPLYARLGWSKERLRQFTAPYLDSRSEAEDNDQKQNLWYSLYQYRSEQAWAWWAILRELYPSEKPVERMQRIEKLFSADGGPQQLLALLPDAERIATKWPADRREQCFAAIVATLKTSGDDVNADKLIKQWTTDTHNVELLFMYAEGCAEQKDWANAAKAYEDSWKGDKKPLALFLSGAALVRAGKEAEGKQAMLRARTMMVADDSQLRQFEEALKKRSWTGAVEEEDEFLVHTATDVWALAAALTGKAERAAKRDDFAAAAAAMERINLYNCLADRGAGPQAWYIFREHIYRAREMAKTGKFAEMMSELKIAMSLNDHGASDIAELVISLEKAGHKPEADQVYAAAKKSGEEYLKEKPSDVTRLNNVAWLLAYCKRDLDQGLSYAQRGMQGDSELPYLIDTLAEILFQRGETQKAIDLETRCCAMNGTHKYYFRQLARFRAGDKTTPIPDEDW